MTLQAHAQHAAPTVLNKMLRKNGSALTADLVRLILACAVATGGPSDDLVRVLAWSAWLAFGSEVQAAGWDWLLLLLRSTTKKYAGQS